MIKYSFFSFLFFSIFISNFSIAQIPLDGLVGYYMCNGIAADSSGLSHDGIIVGDVTATQDRFGNEDGALRFNGGHVDAGNPAAYQISDSISVAAWINPTQLNDWAAIVTKWDDFGSGGYYLGINPDGNIIRWNLDMPTPLDGNSVSINTWTHIASTYDGDSVKIYQDGQLVVGAPYNSPITNNSASLFLGTQFNIPNSFQFFGAMDDVLVYNRALSAEEILVIFDPTTPIHELEENNLEISIYPNPTSDYLFIENKNNHQISSISLFDANGRFIRSVKDDSSPIDLSDLTKGIYFVNIIADNNIINKKVTVF